ncbi:MGMT family protein [Faecalibacter macacae]|uniref:MGMT family protein n=1 Tax=Faecalibacter macacae TaxID=1859289 RepID=A0A3L9MD59_9FLAO|nr:MGMT family protein [Faecalibacter macacae]RLZ09916.1 MGMT family protein [Faecalibacter macacae]
MTKEVSDTYKIIYEIVKQIPKGKVTSYGVIAKTIGAGFSARVVGYAMNHAHDLEDVPAHRVVNRNGLLTGKHHFSPPELMIELLEQEGIKIKNDQVVNFKQHLWNPLEEENYL